MVFASVGTSNSFCTWIVLEEDIHSLPVEYQYIEYSFMFCFNRELALFLSRQSYFRFRILLNEPRIELPERPFVQGCLASKKGMGVHITRVFILVEFWLMMQVVAYATIQTFFMMCFTSPYSKVSMQCTDVEIQAETMSWGKWQPCNQYWWPWLQVHWCEKVSHTRPGKIPLHIEYSFMFCFKRELALFLSRQSYFRLRILSYYLKSIQDDKLLITTALAQVWTSGGREITW